MRIQTNLFFVVFFLCVVAQSTALCTYGANPGQMGRVVSGKTCDVASWGEKEISILDQSGTQLTMTASSDVSQHGASGSCTFCWSKTGGGRVFRGSMREGE